jgi:hypothetical protein
VVLSIANAHSKEDHEEEQGIKYLSHKQKCLVAESVKIAASICADVENFSQLADNLYHVKRTVSPTTHARNLIMPTQSLIKRLIKENPEADNTSLLRYVRECADDYKHYFIHDRLDEGRPHLSGIDAALTLLESFHVLEATDERWSDVHLFKCNCPKFFKTGSCHSSLLAGMVCDPKIRIPKRYLGITLQGRRKRGRPSGKEQIGDLEAAKYRARQELHESYQVPKVPLLLYSHPPARPPAALTVMLGAGSYCTRCGRQ